jgi:hypothetical protein
MTDRRCSRPARQALALPQRVVASLTALLVVTQFFLARAGAFDWAGVRKAATA